eukprot:1141000-Pelagomonas_calceolata.AAC.1
MEFWRSKLGFMLRLIRHVPPQLVMLKPWCYQRKPRDHNSEAFQKFKTETETLFSGTMGEGSEAWDCKAPVGFSGLGIPKHLLDLRFNFGDPAGCCHQRRRFTPFTARDWCCSQLGTCSPFWKYHADLLLFIGWAYTWSAPPGTSSENTQTAVKRVLDQLDGEQSSAYLAGADLDSFQISGAVASDTTPPALDSGAQAGPDAVRTGWHVLLGAALGVVLLLPL